MIVGLKVGQKSTKMSMAIGVVMNGFQISTKVSGGPNAKMMIRSRVAETRVAETRVVSGTAVHRKGGLKKTRSPQRNGRGGTQMLP